MPTSDHWDHIFIEIHIILLRSCPWGTKDHYFISKVRIVFLMCTTNELVHPSAMNFVCHSNVQSLSLVRVFCSSAPQTFVFTALNNLVPSVKFIISVFTSFYTLFLNICKQHGKAQIFMQKSTCNFLHYENWSVTPLHILINYIAMWESSILYYFSFLSFKNFAEALFWSFWNPCETQRK